jgi:hypothetical protein
MKPMRKPKLGLAGVMCTPFRGDKEGGFKTSRSSLEKLAGRLDFEFHAVEQGIYNLKQAEEAAGQLQAWAADFILLQASSFASGDFILPFATLSIPLGLWAVPEGGPTSEGGLPLNSFTAANLYNSILKTPGMHYPLPVKWFLGNPGQPYFDRRLEVSLQALRARLNLSGARVGLVGGVAPGFHNLVVDYAKLKQQLDIQVVEVDLEEVWQKAGQVGQDQAEAAAQRIRRGAVKLDGELVPALLKSARVDLALQQVVEERDLQALAISCWPRFQSDYNLAACTVLGSLNSEGLVAACEGDVPAAVGMLALRSLANAGVVTLMDLATIDPGDDSVLLWHCGPTSPLLADERGTRMEPLWLFDGPQGSRTGLHNDLVLKPGAVTVLGFTADFEHLLVLSGEIDNTKPGYNGSRGWLRSLHLNNEPVTAVDLVQTLMASGYQHHYPLAYGELAEACLELASWLGVRPIPVERYTSHLKPNA